MESKPDEQRNWPEDRQREKTILNRINELRKQFSPQIVPYRKVRKAEAKKTGK